MRKTNTLSCLQYIRPMFLSNALKQTKAGPLISGTPLLVSYKMNPPVSGMLVPDPSTPKYMPLPI